MGSKIFPRDLDIFFSSESIQPCPNIFFGNGNFAANKKAGQKTAWNLNMSLPIICTSAGQKFLYFSLSVSGKFKALI